MPTWTGLSPRSKTSWRSGRTCCRAVEGEVHPMTSSSESVDAGAAVAQRSSARKTLAVAGFAHALHDGYTDLIYVLLPVWQAEFALGYGMLALLRGLSTGAMARLQVPAGRLAEWCGGGPGLSFCAPLGRVRSGLCRPPGGAS